MPGSHHLGWAGVCLSRCQSPHKSGRRLPGMMCHEPYPSFIQHPLLIMSTGCGERPVAGTAGTGGRQRKILKRQRVPFKEMCEEHIVEGLGGVYRVSQLPEKMIGVEMGTSQKHGCFFSARLCWRLQGDLEMRILILWSCFLHVIFSPARSVSNCFWAFGCF